MYAERRLKLYHSVSMCILVYYSFLLVVGGVFESKIESKFDWFSEFSVAASILVLILSSIMFGVNWGGLSAQHKSCYLRLEELIGVEDDEAILKSKYYAILDGFPNHGITDYEDFLVRESFVLRKKICNESGPVEISAYLIGTYYFRRIFMLIFVVFLVVVPILFPFALNYLFGT